RAIASVLAPRIDTRATASDPLPPTGTCDTSGNVSVGSTPGKYPSTLAHATPVLGQSVPIEFAYTRILGMNVPGAAPGGWSPLEYAGFAESHRLAPTSGSVM